MSYCSARTNLRLWRKWQKPTALSPPLSPSLYVSFASLCPSGRADSHHTENPRLYHSCAVVRRPVTGALCGCRQNDRRSLGSLVSLQRLTTDSHDWWRKAFPPSYGPPGTAVRFMRKAEGRMRQEEGEVVWPADNTWQETDRFDMRTCPHLCSGKGKTWAALLQTEPVNTDTPPSDRIPAMRLNLFHFLCLDLGSLAATHL